MTGHKAVQRDLSVVRAGGMESPGTLPVPTHLLGAVGVAHLVIDVRDHLQRPTQRRQRLPAGKVATSD